MTDKTKKPMNAKDLAAIAVGIAITTEIPKNSKKELINAVFEAELGIKDLLTEEEE